MCDLLVERAGWLAFRKIYVFPNNYFPWLSFLRRGTRFRVINRLLMSFQYSFFFFWIFRRFGTWSFELFELLRISRRLLTRVFLKRSFHRSRLCYLVFKHFIGTSSFLSFLFRQFHSAVFLFSFVYYIHGFDLFLRPTYAAIFVRFINAFRIIFNPRFTHDLPLFLL